MRCQLHADRQTDVTCGDCGGPICSECQKDQQDGRWLCADCVRERVAHSEMASRPAFRPATRSDVAQTATARFNSLSTLARVLCAIALVVGLIGVFDERHGISSPSNIMIGSLGIAAGVFMFRRASLGWMLAMLWALTQMIVIISGNLPLNTVRGFIGANVTINGNGLGLNLLAVIYAVLLFKIRHEFLENSAPQCEATT